ncbi:3-carboxy-cis,cis-muconate cycloisomerase [Kineococcus xinjiangensis]|uniref:3-carboxy-cis,cis-muconate cycloisomerase n=1 Tax=Kineococcus xinjiangensis TaxID=512762 RepID=A0A2S6IPJ4_9ACTN|nr:lyase family protein [Kineococcus xinjiangensis]PPK96016.1 3-carboxy-cis,cis-muconate cycloisomerase [Kineococcus xinjiangensis]
MTSGPASLFDAQFGAGEVAGLVDAGTWFATLVEVEAELVLAAADAGAVPAAEAAAVAATLRSALAGGRVSPADVVAASALSGNPVVPLVPALRALVPQEQRRWVHLGATSQDVLDTAMVLVARRAVAALTGDLDAAVGTCLALAGEHAGTPLLGRTLLQAALPTTFGLKAATWASALDGACARLGVVVAALPVQYAGPVGTLSGTPERGQAIRSALARRLRLADAPGPWHTVRLPVADLAGALCTAAGAVATVAVDVLLLAQTEVGEVREGAAGRGGSSSMPHKANPVAAVTARACARRAPGLGATLFAAMEQEHERAAGAWHAEWEALSDLLRVTGSAAHWIRDCLASLEVDAAAMRRTLDAQPVELRRGWERDGGNVDTAAAALQAGRMVDEVVARRSGVLPGGMPRGGTRRADAGGGA